MNSVIRNHPRVQPLLVWIAAVAVLSGGAQAADTKGYDKPVVEKKAPKPASGKAARPTGKQPDLPAPTVLPTTSWLPRPTTPNPAAEADSESLMKPYSDPIPGTEQKIEMVPVRGGNFLMGSPKAEPGRQDNEGPQHEVKIAPFWMGKYEVSWDEYDPWGMSLDFERRKAKKIAPTPHDQLVDAIARPSRPYSDMTFGMGREGYPAICMTQFAAKMYCKWLSAKTGHYYRLPTEAEWEYACRAGTTTAFSFGDDPKKLDEHGWHYDNAEEKYHKRGLKRPNPWGLYDMHGNVSEWTLDQFTTDYCPFAGRVADNPLVLPKAEYGRVVRGGSWDEDPVKARSAGRRGSEKDWKKQDPQIPQSVWYLTDATFVGFRVVRPLRVPTPEEAKKYEVDDAQLQALKDYREATAGKE